MRLPRSAHGKSRRGRADPAGSSPRGRRSRGCSASPGRPEDRAWRPGGPRRSAGNIALERDLVRGASPGPPRRARATAPPSAALRTVVSVEVRAALKMGPPRRDGAQEETCCARPAVRPAHQEDDARGRSTRRMANGIGSGQANRTRSRSLSGFSSGNRTLSRSLSGFSSGNRTLSRSLSGFSSR